MKSAVFSGLLLSIGGGSSPHFFGKFSVLLVSPRLPPSLSLPPPPPPPPPPSLPLPPPSLLVSFPVSCLPVLIEEKMEPVAPAVAIAEPVLVMACETSEKKKTEIEMI